MMSDADSSNSVIIIGGGWAGLTAAVYLSRAGQAVTLIESARQLGGRARCLPFDELRVDNGQHLMIGAYHEMLALLDILGVAETDVFLRQPLDLHLHSLNGQRFRLRFNSLPSPFNALRALLSAQGLSWLDRLRLSHFMYRLRKQRVEITRDITAQAMLLSERQPPRLISRLWEPLCLAALNTPLNDASAKLFLETLQQSFTDRQSDADFLFCRTDIGTAIPTPALQYIEANGGKIILSKRVQKLRIAPHHFQVQWSDGSLTARHLIVATNPVMSRRLLSPHPELDGITDRLAQLRHAPICTVYLRYPPHISLDQPMLGILDGIGQWVFDRRLCQQPGLMAVIISGPGPHMALDNDELTARIVQELSTLNPDWPRPLSSRVIREKRATFYAGVDVNSLRPSPCTPVPGLWLAGDYTATGLPATLEGAILSGRRCAEQILHSQ